MQLTPDTLLHNRYRILEVLGQGGMGSVYRAIDENLGVEVAVKDNMFTTAEYARQFKREAMILASLRHPNLPRVTDHFVIEGKGQYLVMDYIEGEDLRERMERIGTIPEEEVIAIGAAVCDALTYLNSRTPPIVHRDIKPGNIKITPQGQIYLVDFGLAKAMKDMQVTTTGARAMTPGFSPPEQYGTARTDHRSDIYSLAATLYAALTGTLPEDALSRAMDQSELTPVRKHNPEVSPKLAAAIEKALSVRPDDRFQTAEEFKRALLSARKEGPIREFSVTPPPLKKVEPASEAEVKKPVEIKEGKPPETPEARKKLEKEGEVETVKKKPSRKRGGCIWAFLLLLILGFGGWFWVTRVDPGLIQRVMSTVSPRVIALLFTPTASPAVLPEAITPTNTQTLFSQTATLSTESVTTTLTSTTLPTMTFTPLPSPTFTNTPTPLPTPLGGGGGCIAFASNQTGRNQVYVINVDGSGLRQITNLEEGACQPDWSPDGKRLVFVSPCSMNKDYYQNSSLYIINADGTGLLPLPTVLGGDYDPAWSPDGKFIAFASLRNTGRPRIYVFDLEANIAKLLSDKFGYDFQPAWSADGSQIIYVSKYLGLQQIWVMDADGQNKRQLYKDSRYLHYKPSWSLDGQWVVFTQLVTEGSIPWVVVAPYTTEGNLEVFRVGQSPIPMREAVFSPDGIWLAFEGWEAGGSHDIYVIAVSGAGKRRITSDPGLEFDVDWCPVPPSF